MSVAPDQAPSVRRPVNLLPAQIVLAVLAVCGLVFAGLGFRAHISAPIPTTDTQVVEPVQFIYPEPSEEVEAANVAATLAMQQYVDARLVTERFLVVDFAEEPNIDEVATIIDEALASLADADLIISQGLQIIDAAVGEEVTAPSENAGSDSTDSDAASSNAPPSDVFWGQPTAYQATSLPKLLPAAPGDQQQWAEEFTKAYDQTKGPKKLQTLARQLGQDVKDIKAQLDAAQEIIHSGATKDASFWDKMTKAAMATKTVAKVGLFVGATIATAGGAAALAAPTAAGSLAPAASTGGVGLAGAASIVINGADVMVEIGETTSAITLGEDHKLTAAFGSMQDTTGPLSGATFVAFPNPTDTVGLIADLSGNIMDYFADGRLWGFKMERYQEGEVALDKLLAGDNSPVLTVTPLPEANTEEELESNLAAAGLSLPPQQVESLDEAIAQVDVMELSKALEVLDALAQQLEIELASPDQPGEPEAEQQASDSPVVGVYQYRGTYSAHPFDPGDEPMVTEFDPHQAVITLDENKMTITIDDGRPTVLQGTFDSQTNTFTGIDNSPASGEAWDIPLYQRTQTTVTFDIGAEPVVGIGYAGDEIENISMVFTRTGDLP